MMATILTDASWCQYQQVGGWGYWIASNRRPRGIPTGKRGGGGMLLRCSGSNVAEMMAIVNAVHVALASGLVEHGDPILVQSDSVAAIGALSHKRTCHDVDQQDVLARWASMVAGSDLRVHFKHVKGHTNRNTHTEARFGANRMCDQRARRYMEQARKHKEQQVGAISSH